MTQRPSTAAYQASRKAMLRSLERDFILASARKLARENQRKGHSYKRTTLNALRGKQ